MMAANRTLRNKPGTVDDVIHRVKRGMDDITWLIVTIS